MPCNKLKTQQVISTFEVAFQQYSSGFEEFTSKTVFWSSKTFSSYNTKTKIIKAVFSTADGSSKVMSNFRLFFSRNPLVVQRPLTWKLKKWIDCWSLKGHLKRYWSKKEDMYPFVFIDLREWEFNFDSLQNVNVWE